MYWGRRSSAAFLECLVASGGHYELSLCTFHKTFQVALVVEKGKELLKQISLEEGDTRGLVEKPNANSDGNPQIWFTVTVKRVVVPDIQSP